jgi:hypothetical protein
VEGHTATALDHLLEDPAELDAGDRATLAYFFGLIGFRTPVGADRLAASSDAMSQVMFAGRLIHPDVSSVSTSRRWTAMPSSRSTAGSLACAGELVETAAGTCPGGGATRSRGTAYSVTVRRVTICALSALLALGASACGGAGPSDEEISADRQALTTAIAAEIRTRDVAHLQAKAKKRAQACRSRVAGFVEALRDVDSRLDVGLSYSEYSDAVGDAAVERGRAGQAASAGRACARIASAAESAFDLYNGAVQTWNDCVFDDPVSIFDVGCSLDDIEFDLQLEWLKATDHVEKAVKRLEALGSSVPDPPTYLTTVPRLAASVEGSIYGQTAKQLCGGEAPVVAAEQCAELREILGEGVEEGEEDDLNDALLGITEAYGITPAALAPDDEE